MKSDKIPMFAIGNDELDPSNKIKKGDLVKCTTCGGAHPVALGSSSRFDTKLNKLVDDGESNAMQFYSCGKKCFMCGIDGVALPGIEIVKDYYEDRTTD